MRRLVVLFLFFVDCLAIFRLSEISISKGIVTLPVQNGAKLYLSSNDDIGLLGKIKITNNLSTKTALELSTQGTNVDGTMMEWTVTGQVTISSTNTEFEAERLTGYVYFTTFTQAQDINFLVYSVDKPTLISYNNADLTVVFLNQNLKLVNQPMYVPQMSSRVSDYSQGQGSSVSLYWNEPTETYKNPKSDDSKQQMIFSNPIFNTFKKNYQLFDSVEPFQIFNEIWFMRSKGQVRFQVQPKWEDPNGTTTSKVTTTGFVMCSYAPENITINMVTNPANAATSGFAFVYNVISNVTFAMSGMEMGVDNENRTTFNQRNSTSDGPSTFFKISAEEAVAGQFAVQYFQTEGSPLPTTTPGPSTDTPSTSSISSTTVTVPTTTRTAASVFGVIQLFIIFVLNI